MKNATQLKALIRNIAANRKVAPQALLQNSGTALCLLSDGEAMQAQWGSYQRAFSYARNISWTDVIRAIRMVGELLS